MVATLALAPLPAVLAPLPALAQFGVQQGAQSGTVGSGMDLLRPTPSLSGSSVATPRFVRTGDATGTLNGQTLPTQRFLAPSRIGRTPIYGSPTGFGAGDTGFDSSNARRRNRLRPAPPATLGPPPETTFETVPVPPPQVSSRPPLRPSVLPPVVFPARAAARPGAVLPPPPDELPITNPPPEVHPLAAATRRGAVLPLPPPIDEYAPGGVPPPVAAQDAASTPRLGTLPLNSAPVVQATTQLPLGEGDAYAPLGLRAGTFLLFPALDLTAVHDSNPQHAYSGGPSYYFVGAPELRVRSDWAQHAFSADIVANYQEFTHTFAPSLDRPYVNARIDGRVDVDRYTQIILENRFLLTTDNPGSPNIQAGLAKLPPNYTIGATLGVLEQFNRLNVSLRGTFDRSIYAESDLTNGTIFGNTDRNLDQYAGILRVGYELTPGLRPFAEVQQDTRIHDLQYDRNDEQRNSLGTAAKAGTAFDIFTTLTGEVAVGYVERTYADPGLPKISGTTVDGSVLWQPTPITSVRLLAQSTVSESILDGVSGELSRGTSIQVDHALRRWLVLTAQGGFAEDDYVGNLRIDHRWFASMGLIYKLNPYMQVRGEVREDWLTSSQSGNAYSATALLFGMRFQD